MSREEACANWITLSQLVGRCDASEDADLLNDCIKMASDVLYNYTKRRWPGSCTDTVRPCRRSCHQPGSWAGWFAGTSEAAKWGNAGGGFGGIPGIPGQASAQIPSQAPCGCGYISEFELPRRDVTAIVAVRVDGVLLVEGTDYRLDDGYRLVRLGGEVWPTCQNLLLADTEEGTWSVEYDYGLAPPIGGEKACIALACQLAWAHKPEAVRDGRCRLPRRVTSVTRQGVTMALLDPLTLFDDGKTGIAEVDMWIASVNRGDDSRSGAVIDPLRERTVRRTG